MTEQQAENEQAQEITIGQGIAGCLAVLLIVAVITYWLVGVVGRWNDFDKIALTQASAMMEQVLEETNGAEDITDLILAQPAGTRREHAEQLAEYWVNSGQPALHPTEGVSDDWLERDSARRVVVDEMVVLLMKWTQNRP